MSSDIRPYGAGHGLGFYWVRKEDGVGVQIQAYRALVAIDELGNVHDTGTRADDDAAAPSEQEAVLEHLAQGIKQADAALEKRRAKLPAVPEEPHRPTYPDRATADFFGDPD